MRSIGSRVPSSRAFPVFLAFLRLGLTSFGGPVAHLGYFREAFVVRRQWLDDAGYGDIVALCQVLPGPASSQVGMMIGLSRAGFGGALAAWLGFTLPSAIVMIAGAYGVGAIGAGSDGHWRRWLELVAVAVVAQAVIGMAKRLCRDRTTAAIALASAAVVLVRPDAGGQDLVMLASALAGYGLYRGRVVAVPPGRVFATSGKRAGAAALVLFATLLFGLPLLQMVTGSPLAGLFAVFYRAGALVFGGGHVVLPLLAAAITTQGPVSREDFLTGYALAQAVPGPLFTIAGYLGTLMSGGPPRWLGGVVALLAIFTPSFLLVFGVAPFWQRWGRRPEIRAALIGVNAAVVGLLLAALLTPLASSAIHGVWDVALAVLAFLLLTRLAVPAWLLVALALLIGRFLPLGV